MKKKKDQKKGASKEADIKTEAPLQSKDELVKHLVAHLKGGHAHATIEQALDGLPEHLRGVVVAGLPYSIWQLVYHIRIAQWDILDFSKNPDYKSMNWPDDYWPKENAPKNNKEWNDTVKQIFADRDKFIALLEDKSTDLFTLFPYGDGQNLLKEALLILDHNGYHIAEIIMIRRLLGAWKPA
jgi:hypothetical protein